MELTQGKYKVVCTYHDRVGCDYAKAELFTVQDTPEETAKYSNVPEEIAKYTVHFSGTFAECEKRYMENWESFQLE